MEKEDLERAHHKARACFSERSASQECGGLMTHLAAVLLRGVSRRGRD